MHGYLIIIFLTNLEITLLQRYKITCLYAREKTNIFISENKNAKSNIITL